MVPISPTGRILVVCTGNVCRSPFIQRLLQAQLPASVEVSSAGTEALVGSPIDPGSVAQLDRLGVASGPFAACQLTAEMVSAADLVITATRAHRAAVARVHPRGLRTAYTLGDLADLADGVDSSGAPGDHKPKSDAGSDVGSDAGSHAESDVARVVALVAARRGMVPPRPAAEVDIIDPFRREDAVFTAMAEQVCAVLPQVVRLLSA